jgi:hypothetical protein
VKVPRRLYTLYGGTYRAKLLLIQDPILLYAGECYDATLSRCKAGIHICSTIYIRAKMHAKFMLSNVHVHHHHWHHLLDAFPI